MANVYLGPAGTELLPAVKWVGSAPDWPSTIDPQTEEAKMMDGSRRWAFFSGVNEWGIAFGYLDLTELNILRALVALKRILRFRDDNVDATVYDVVIVAFSYKSVFPTMRGFPRFVADMTLRQA